MKSPLKWKIYFALLTDNTTNPIKVTIEVAVIQITQQWETRTIQVMKVTNRQDPI